MNEIWKVREKLFQRSRMRQLMGVDVTSVYVWTEKCVASSAMAEPVMYDRIRRS